MFDDKSILAKRKFGEHKLTEKEIKKQEKSILAKRKFGKEVQDGKQEKDN